MSSNTSSTRRRKKEEDTAEPVDEVIQEQEVAELREEAQEQMNLIHNVFSRVCEGAMFLCLVLGVASRDVWCWIHVVVACCLHWSAIRIAGLSRHAPGEETSKDFHQYMPIVALVVLLVISVPQALSSETHAIKSQHISDMEHLHHMGLAGSNAITMMLALYIKKDNESTVKQILALEKSKYKYKSL